MNIAKKLFSNSGSERRLKCRCGFTLVEMLVSMAILVMIVLLMGRMFSDGSSAFKKGIKQSDQNLNGRVVLDYVALELRQAIIDENLVLKVQPGGDDPYKLGEGLNDWVSFAAVGGKSREVELLRYYVRLDTNTIGGVEVDSYSLMRGINTGENILNNAYKSAAWADNKGSPQQMARNVSGFAVRLFDDLDGDGEVECIREELGTDTYTARTLPVYADIYLGLLGDSDLVEAHLKGNTDNFVHKKEMIFMKRVYFRNRQGYNTGYGRDLYRASE